MKVVFEDLTINPVSDNLTSRENGHLPGCRQPSESYSKACRGSGAIGIN